MVLRSLGNSPKIYDNKNKKRQGRRSQIITSFLQKAGELSHAFPWPHRAGHVLVYVYFVGISKSRVPSTGSKRPNPKIESVGSQQMVDFHGGFGPEVYIDVSFFPILLF